MRYFSNFFALRYILFYSCYAVVNLRGGNNSSRFSLLPRNRAPEKICAAKFFGKRSNLRNRHGFCVLREILQNAQCCDVVGSSANYQQNGLCEVAHLLPAACAAVVGSSGLEPPTSRLSGVCSNQLSYDPVGGGNRVRTDDPLLAGQVLYQLSYTPNLY